MEKEKYALSGGYSVLLPYRDLELLLETAGQLDQLKGEIQTLQARYTGLQSLYFELVQKVSEISKLL